MKTLVDKNGNIHGIYAVGDYLVSESEHAQYLIMDRRVVTDSGLCIYDCICVNGVLEHMSHSGYWLYTSRYNVYTRVSLSEYLYSVCTHL